MQFIVNLSIAAETETAEEALEMAKTGKGKTISFSVNARPTATPQGSAAGRPAGNMVPRPAPVQRPSPDS